MLNRATATRRNRPDFFSQIEPGRTLSRMIFPQGLWWGGYSHGFSRLPRLVPRRNRPNKNRGRFPAVGQQPGRTPVLYANNSIHPPPVKCDPHHMETWGREGRLSATLQQLRGETGLRFCVNTASHRFNLTFLGKFVKRVTDLPRLKTGFFLDLGDIDTFAAALDHIVDRCKNGRRL